MTGTDGVGRSQKASGLVLHRAGWYDMTVWFFTRGKERRFRERLLDLARLEIGESVLDVGCGTGTLAIAAKRRVRDGLVYGVDASAEMIARAERKAVKTHAEVCFRRGLAESLPFPDGTLDVVLNTVMLHHLPKPTRQVAAREMRRVLRPAGRVLAVDFSTPSRERHGLIAHLHRHGHTRPPDLRQLFADAGFTEIESGAVGLHDLAFVLAARPAGVDG